MCKELWMLKYTGLENCNKKTEHLLTLLTLCEKIQRRLMARGRSIHHDYIIINLFNLVSQYPYITERVLLKIYRHLLKSSCAGEDFSVALNENESLTFKAWFNQQ